MINLFDEVFKIKKRRGILIDTEIFNNSDIFINR